MKTTRALPLVHRRRRRYQAATQVAREHHVAVERLVPQTRNAARKLFLTCYMLGILRFRGIERLLRKDLHDGNFACSDIFVGSTASTLPLRPKNLL